MDRNPCKINVSCTVLNDRKKWGILFSNSPSPVAFLLVISKVAALALATQICNISFYLSWNRWHLILEILAIHSMILGYLINIALNKHETYACIFVQRSIRIRAYWTIHGDSNDGYASMIIYMLAYISIKQIFIYKFWNLQFTVAACFAWPYG